MVAKRTCLGTCLRIVSDAHVDQDMPSSLSRTLGTHLKVGRLQDPTDDGRLSLGGTILVISNLVTDHPRPRAVFIVHGDISPDCLSGIICPEASPAYSTSISHHYFVYPMKKLTLHREHHTLSSQGTR